MPDWIWLMVGALATLLSAVILAVGLFFTLRQLKFLRHSNELATLTKLAELYDSEPLVQSREFIRSRLPALMEDATFRDELEAFPLSARAEELKPIGNFYEDLGAYVVSDAVSEHLALLLYGEVVVEAWNLSADAIMVIRRSRPGIWAEFEELAKRANAWHATPEFKMRHRPLYDRRRDPWRDADDARKSGPPGVRSTPA